jgi:hypothetical protein
MSDIGMDSYVDIGTLPISEWQFSVWHICLRYQNNRCRCRMSDIADIRIDVDAHLCLDFSPVRLSGQADSCRTPLFWEKNTNFCRFVAPIPLLCYSLSLTICQFNPIINVDISLNIFCEWQVAISIHTIGNLDYTSNHTPSTRQFDPHISS